MESVAVLAVVADPLSAVLRLVAARWGEVAILGVDHLGVDMLRVADNTRDPAMGHNGVNYSTQNH